ncbi:hypothetical protein NHN26_03865 [Rhodovulum tesquicola]|uniref:hypothetical protein n=1 Tax=Rhodovulum tesquicola TaxID=540254 RepID=UPI00209776EA|nr:hypothetical protein [Rhodovulum tesquicola]MCO8144357.1 hypothetical protein [Rhodovulum tesquicola]
MSPRSTLSLVAGLVGAIGAGSALASGVSGAQRSGISYLEKGVLSYEVFEMSVAHEDLSECPQEFDPGAVFCRYAETDHSASIFVFSYDEEMPLLAVKYVSLDEGKAILKAEDY